MEESSYRGGMRSGTGRAARCPVTTARMAHANAVAKKNPANAPREKAPSHRLAATARAQATFEMHCAALVLDMVAR